MIAIGVAMQRSGFVSPTFLREANRVTYWLGLPALLFSQLASSFHGIGEAKLMLATMFWGTLAALAFGYLGARLQRVSGASTGTYVQGAMRGNLAFVG